MWEVPTGPCSARTTELSFTIHVCPPTRCASLKAVLLYPINRLVNFDTQLELLLTAAFGELLSRSD